MRRARFGRRRPRVRARARQVREGSPHQLDAIDGAIAEALERSNTGVAINSLDEKVPRAHGPKPE